MTSHLFSATLLALLITVSLGPACGVKGPPLPPVPDTPKDSDIERIPEESADVAPVSKPSPSPTAKSTQKKGRNQR